MKLINLKEHKEYVQAAAAWFHGKWGIPLETYRESMEACVDGGKAVPQWYLAVEQEAVIGGAGVIENDFHNRRDLAPNVCALYVEETYRCRGIAGNILAHICEDMREMGIDTLYLITDHTSFYERYGWEFLCMVQGDGEPEPTRMYVRKSEGAPGS